MSTSVSRAASLSNMPLPALSRLVLSAALTLVTWQLRRHMRHDLSRLSPHLLDDIGIDRHSAESEVEKPFWRP